MSEVFPLVSIIVPVFNCRNYLEECVMNVLGQSYSNWELLLIDDGSTDGSGDECDQLSSKDQRIKVYHAVNSGVSAARNLGLQNAKGEYIVFLDADDWWNYDFLRQMTSALQYCDIPFCRLVKVTSDNVEHVAADLNLTSSPTSNIIACWRGLFSRTVLDKQKIKFSVKLKTGEDQEFVYKYLLFCKRPGFIPEAQYYYRVNPQSAMFKKTYAHFDAVEALKSAVAYAREYGSAEQIAVYEHDLLRYNALRTIEFATLTLLTAGEPWQIIYKFLEKRGYVSIMDMAVTSGDCHKSSFYELWKNSHTGCLRRYAFRKFLGRIGRKVLFWK